MEELSERFEELVKPIEKRLILVWIAQIPGYAIYIFIAYKAQMKLERFADRESEISLTVLLAVIALFCLAISLVFKRLTISPSAIAKRLSGATPTWPPVNPQMEKQLDLEGELKNLSSEEGILLRFSISSLTSFMIFYGFFNSCAIAGLALSILIGEPKAVFPFIACAAVAQLLNFPNLRRLLRQGLLEWRNSPN